MVYCVEQRHHQTARACGYCDGRTKERQTATQVRSRWSSTIELLYRCAAEAAIDKVTTSPFSRMRSARDETGFPTHTLAIAMAHNTHALSLFLPDLGQEFARMSTILYDLVSARVRWFANDSRLSRTIEVTFHAQSAYRTIHWLQPTTQRESFRQILTVKKPTFCTDAPEKLFRRAHDDCQPTISHTRLPCVPRCFL